MDQDQGLAIREALGGRDPEFPVEDIAVMIVLYPELLLSDFDFGLELSVWHRIGLWLMADGLWLWTSRKPFFPVTTLDNIEIISICQTRHLHIGRIECRINGL